MGAALKSNANNNINNNNVIRRTNHHQADVITIIPLTGEEMAERCHGSKSDSQGKSWTRARVTDSGVLTALLCNYVECLHTITRSRPTRLSGFHAHFMDEGREAQRRPPQALQMSGSPKKGSWPWQDPPLPKVLSWCRRGALRRWWRLDCSRGDPWLGRGWGVSGGAHL